MYMYIVCYLIRKMRLPVSQRQRSPMNAIHRHTFMLRQTATLGLPPPSHWVVMYTTLLHMTAGFHLLYFTKLVHTSHSGMPGGSLPVQLERGAPQCWNGLVVMAVAVMLSLLCSWHTCRKLALESSARNSRWISAQVSGASCNKICASFQR